MIRSRRRLVGAALALLLCTAACARAQPKPELAGTSWQLVEVQYMDDTTVRPDDGAKYTLAFRDDGDAEARADCNRAATTYTSPQPGQLVFGVFAATLAACPPGSLDARFLRDLGYVRSYLLRDGRLYLSLMADGGIYTFAPAGRGPLLFRCAGLDGLVSVTYVGADAAVARIARNGVTLELRATPAASGAKYVGASPEQLFWEHHGEVTYREGAAQPETKCAPAAPDSPGAR